MPRKNRRRAGPQPQRRNDKAPAPLPRPHPEFRAPVEKMIIPHGRCHLRHRKLRFLESEAPTALKQARAGRIARGQSNPESNYYECKKSDGGCGYWHLTSRTNFVKRGTS